jgi:hypothetical protein
MATTVRLHIERVAHAHQEAQKAFVAALIQKDLLEKQEERAKNLEGKLSTRK